MIGITWGKRRASVHIPPEAQFGAGVALGAGIGAGVGIAIQYPGLGVALGIALGVGISTLLLDRQGKAPRDTGERLLLDQAGRGASITQAFVADADGAVRVHWEVAGRSPSGLLPHATFALRRKGSTGSQATAVTFRGQQRDGSATSALPPGVYVIRVLATPWTSWRVRVTMA